MKRANEPSNLWALLGLEEGRFTSSTPSFRVMLDSCGADKSAAIRELRGIFGTYHLDARFFLESAPKEFERDFTFLEAAGWVLRLSFVGCASHVQDLPQATDLALCRQSATRELPDELALYFLLCRDEALTRIVAQNPHLSRSGMSLVAAFAPAQFLENPLLPLLLLEDPTLQQLDERAVASMIKQEGALPTLYPAALAHHESSIALAKEDLTQLPTGIVEALSRSDDWGVENALAYNQSAPLWVLERLSTSTRRHIAEAVALHPTTTPELLESLSHSNDGDTLAAVAKNERTPTSVLARLSSHHSRNVVRAASSNPNTPRERLLALAQGADEAMLRALYENPKVPEELLTRELEKKRRDLLLHVTNNERARPEVLVWLYERAFDEVLKFSILRHKSCPEELRQRGLLEESETLRNAAAGRV